MALHAVSAESYAKGKSVMKPKQKCSKVWIDHDAFLESKSMHETISFSRKAKEIKRRVYDWPTEKTKVLAGKYFDDLDKFLNGLCLEKVQNEPPPPPGGPANIKIKGQSGEKRLGWKGNTGGDYFLLRSEELEVLFEKLHSYGPKRGE